MATVSLDYVLDGGMDIVLVNDTPYMFTNLRIDRNTIPEGFVAYDIRESDGGAGDFAEAKEFVMVNHWGTIVGIDPLPLEDGRYYCNEEKEDGCFNGDYVKSLDEFKEEYYGA